MVSFGVRSSRADYSRAHARSATGVDTAEARSYNPAPHFVQSGAGRGSARRIPPIGVSMNVPNSLTILRILLIPVFISLLVYERYTSALVALLVAGVTDALDGTIARITNQRTELGAYLDPLADKLLLTAGFVTLAVLHLIPLWIVIVIVSRDVIITIGTLLVHLTQAKVEISPTLLGKATTLLQLSYLVLVVVLAAREMAVATAQPVLSAMVLVTVVSGLHYLYRGFTQLGAQSR
jgi:cardiolipin synthase (CMP-forming)